jgi:Acetyl-CoA carboxylase, carboxyltransferase component (subunits alpha and beta)
MSLMHDKLQTIENARMERRLTCGMDGIDRQHEQGKLTARERIDLLMDPGTFQEIDSWADSYQYGVFANEIEIPGDALVAGWGEVNGRPVCVWAQDAAFLDGSMAEIHIAKIVRVMEKALNQRVPVIGIYDSEGYRLQSAIMAQSYCSYGSMLRFQTLSSGVIPQVALIMGPCVGGAALSAPLADFVIMVKGKSFLHLTPVGIDATRESYGGAKMHAAKSGTCAVLAENDEDCLHKCRELLSFLPQSNLETAPLCETQDDPLRADEEIMTIIPDEGKKSYDIRRIVKLIADDHKYLEIQAEYAPNLSVGFARFNGQSVGIIANNPRWLGGSEDYRSSDKHSRFTRFCDAMNIPLVYLADCPGFLPSIEQEHAGILRHGCMVIHSTCEATVPKISIILRKIYGGAQLAMPGNFCKADSLWAWPMAERGIMGTDALVSIIYKGSLDRAESPEEKARIMQEARPKMANAVEKSAFNGNEEMIDPRQTRALIIKALKAQRNKHLIWPDRKHGNINL